MEADTLPLFGGETEAETREAKRAQTSLLRAILDFSADEPALLHILLVPAAGPYKQGTNTLP